MVSTDIGMWIAAFIMVAYLSAVVKDNIICRIAMETVVGAGVGHWVLSALVPIYENVLKPLSAGSLEAVLLLGLGTMLLLRLSSKYGWVSRYPNAILFGVGAGVVGAGAVSSMIVGQITATAIDLPSLAGKPADLIGSIILIFSILTMLSFFLFTVPRGRVLRTSQTLGRNWLMFLFGSTYSNAWSIGALQSVMGLIIFNTFGIPEPI